MFELVHIPKLLVGVNLNTPDGKKTHLILGTLLLVTGNFKLLENAPLYLVDVVVVQVGVNRELELAISGFGNFDGLDFLVFFVVFIHYLQLI